MDDRDDSRLPAIRPSAELPARVSVGVAGEDLLRALLSGQSPNTQVAYRKDLHDFAGFLGLPVGPAIEALVGHGHAAGNAAALAYRGHLVDERKLAAATVARRLAALRMVCKVARTLGRINWALETRNPKAEAYRDTTGPGRDGWLRMLVAAREAAATGKPPAVRDLAIALLLHDLGLRRDEVCGLDLAHFNPDGAEGKGVVEVLGKGKTGRVMVTLNAPARSALLAWVAIRGDRPGPLFHRLDRAAGKAAEPGRLDGSAVYDLVGRLGRKAGLGRPVRPHGLRHQGITRGLDLSGGDVRKVQRFSRHAKVETLLRYDDNRRDDAGDIARLLGEDPGL